MRRIFLLSPANSGGKRAAMLARPQATFELARQVQIGTAMLGDVFAFCSGLYFRGKLTYARCFAEGPEDVLVITPTRGLLAVDTAVGLADLRDFATVPVDSKDPRFTTPLRASAEALAAAHPSEIVLLGSVGTGKYLDTLLPVFGERLLFPAAFLGLGDMSRGALLLRSTAARQELAYAPAGGVVRRHASRARRKVDT